MKPTEEVDTLMKTVNPDWRYRWCGAEAGPCACVGCVQIGCRPLMFELATGQPFYGDPEYINESAIPAEIRSACAVTREEWEAWKERHPQLTK